MDRPQQMRSSRYEVQRPKVAARLRTSIKVLAWASLAATRVVFADPSAGAAGDCAAASPQEARELADRLYESGEYQRAGECYDLAGDAMRAQRAFLRAAGPSAEAAARGLKDEGRTAKNLFAQVGQAFRSKH